MLRFLVVCLALLLTSHTKSRQKAYFVKVMKFTHAVCELMIIASQRSLSEATLRWMYQRLVTFHQTKSIFRQSRQTMVRKNRVINLWDDFIRKRFETGWVMGEAQIEWIHWAPELRVNNFAFIKIHLPTHISNCMRYLGFPDNLRTDSSELLHIENLKEAYQETNKVN